MYKCGICGKTYETLDAYMDCVAHCGAELKKKEEAENAQKRIEEVNAALNRVKEAKKYFEDQLKQFQEKYPEEYDLNFGSSNKKKLSTDNTGIKSEKVKKENYNPESVSVSYSKKNDEEPNIRARVNGKDVSPEELFSDPDVKYIAKLLGILD